MPAEQQAHALGTLYSNAIVGWGSCEKKRAKLVDYIRGE